MLLADERNMFCAVIRSLMDRWIDGDPRQIAWFQYGCVAQQADDCIAVYPRTTHRTHAVALFMRDYDCAEERDWTYVRGSGGWRMYLYEDGSNVMARIRSGAELRAKSEG